MISDKKEFIWRISIMSWALIGVTSVLLLYIFHDAIDAFLYQWQREEYSHAYMIPAICAFFVWQKKNRNNRFYGRMAWRYRNPYRI